MKKSLFLLGAIGVQACQRERAFVHHSHAHVKRQTGNATFPPVLDANEQILINSFDNTSISEWSYYYSMPHMMCDDRIINNL
jgi:N-acetylated-alpha-linked acidic dipeptidase